MLKIAIKTTAALNGLMTKPLLVSTVKVLLKINLFKS